MPPQLPPGISNHDSHHLSPTFTTNSPPKNDLPSSPQECCTSATRFLRTRTPTAPAPLSKPARRLARRTARSTPAARPSLPSPAVLIPELIKLILFHTNLRTLLVSAQRVCSAWRNVIVHSPQLQKRLFFTPW
jgi:hypothetical protein